MSAIQELLRKPQNELSNLEFCIRYSPSKRQAEAAVELSALQTANAALTAQVAERDTTITSVQTSYTVYQDEEVEATGFTISWDSDTLGFGELNIMVNVNGEIQIDTENMDKVFYMDLMSKLYDTFTALSHSAAEGGADGIRN